MNQGESVTATGCRGLILSRRQSAFEPAHASNKLSVSEPPASSIRAISARLKGTASLARRDARSVHSLDRLSVDAIV